jgi:hypothetical protein
LSYSIQANNLLVTKISSTQKFTTFLDDYLDKTKEGIQNNDIKLIRITDKDFNPYRVMDIKNKYLQENVKKLIETKVK